MNAYIETINGRYAGTTFAVSEGEVCNIGSTLGNDLFFPNDSLMAPIHFSVSNKDDSLNLHTLNNRVFVNNQIAKVTNLTNLTHGDFVLGGATLFCVSIEGEKSLNETSLGRLINRLSQIDELYLLIDENTDTRILPLIKESESNFRILKDDVKGLEGLTANPLLVEVNKKYLQRFVRTFWGKGRLVFLELRNGLDESLVHFKHLLSKTQIENGVDLRFYDPRMLRVILGEAKKQHAQFFFAGAERYFVESQLPSHLFEFGWSGDGVTAEYTRLSDVIEKIPTQQEIEDFLINNEIKANLISKTERCLRELIKARTKDLANFAEKFIPVGEKFGLKSIVAQIQFVAVTALCGEDLNFDNLLAVDAMSNDKKLDYFVERLNLTRG
jgi:hypothetical protein